ncbi:MAG: methyltransferase domain-containing protein [Acidobacteria bacterium]|nr:MAG: methyltransferase domain-containing protein [Acidobacteriota bacterium]
MSVEYVEKVYNRYSSIYDVVFGKVFHSGREMAPVLLDLFPGAQLLEVGVGTGLSFPLLPRNIQITAVDLSQKMLDRAKKRAQSLALRNINLIKMDATNLNFPDHSFDRVLAAYFVSTVPDPVKVVLEMKRVCKPGGLLVFMNHFQSDNRLTAPFEKAVSPLFYRLGFRTDLNLNRLMEKCQLQMETREKVGFLGNWTAVRCIVP